MTPLEKRFFKKVKKTRGCWIWTGSKSNKGYGRINYFGKNRNAHRISWILAGKKIPKKYFSLHKCNNPSCVKPAHLYAGTATDNMQDALKNGKTLAAKNKRKTHCKNGHPFSGPNLYLNPASGKRACKTCVRKFTLEYYYRNRDVINERRTKPR